MASEDGADDPQLVGIGDEEPVGEPVHLAGIGRRPGQHQMEPGLGVERGVARAMGQQGIDPGSIGLQLLEDLRQLTGLRRFQRAYPALGSAPPLGRSDPGAVGDVAAGQDRHYRRRRRGAGRGAMPGETAGHRAGHGSRRR